MKTSMSLGLLAGSFSLLTAMNASAVEIIQNGGSACSGLNSIYDASLTKRATGLVNESSAAVWVSCNAPVVALHEPPNDSQSGWVKLRFYNPTSSNKTAKCTVLPFIEPDVPITDSTTTSSVQLNPHAPTTLTMAGGYSRFSTERIGVSCSLPGHTVLEEVDVKITEFQFIPIE